jgi:hypothetical protein
MAESRNVPKFGSFCGHSASILRLDAAEFVSKSMGDYSPPGTMLRSETGELSCSFFFLSLAPHPAKPIIKIAIVNAFASFIKP